MPGLGRSGSCVPQGSRSRSGRTRRHAPSKTPSAYLYAVAKPAGQASAAAMILFSGIVGLELVERTCIRRSVQRILNPMVQYTKARLDASFGALSDATRRGVLEQLGGADASITDLAERFHMTLTGMRKHVGVLEQAELVTTEKVGRVRTCKLGPRRLEEETAWIERYRQLWDSRFEELDKIVEELRWKERVDGRKKRQ
jgi:DNA-binding transcriptional ArsR family regulator